jgi:ubiquitin conjugation factor E4 B
MTGSPVKPHLLLEAEDDQGIDLDFLTECVKRFEEEESLKPAFIAVVEEMSRDLSTKTVNDDYKPYVMV